MALAIRDRLGSHNLIKVAAQPGELAAMSFPGEAEGFAAATFEGSPWLNEVSPGAFVTIALHRPVGKAKRLHMPIWVGFGEKDITGSGKAIEKLLRRLPLPGCIAMTSGTSNRSTG